MWQILFVRVLTMIFALGLGACATLSSWMGPKFERPEIKIVGIEIANIGIQELDLLVEIEVTNKNEFDITLQEINYAAESNAKVIAHGTFKETFVAKKHESQKTKLPLKILTSETLQLISALLAKKETPPLKLSGVVSFDTPLGIIEKDFEATRIL